MNSGFEYKGYYTKVEFSPEDHVLIGKIEGIADLVNFTSESATEIEQEFHNAVDDYLAFCEDIGKEPNKPYKGSFNVRIEPELHRKIAMKAMREGISLNQAVAAAIEQATDCSWKYNHLEYDLHPANMSVSQGSFASIDITSGFATLQ